MYARCQREAADKRMLCTVFGASIQPKGQKWRDRVVERKEACINNSVGMTLPKLAEPQIHMSSLHPDMVWRELQSQRRRAR
jgi:hypothetical protein